MCFPKTISKKDMKTSDKASCD